MAENTVRYYNDESYDDADSDETTDMDDAVKNDAEQKPEISMRKNEAQSGSVIMIIFISLLAAALLGSVIYSLDKRNTMYNKVAAMNEKLETAAAENVRLYFYQYLDFIIISLKFSSITSILTSLS